MCENIFLKQNVRIYFIMLSPLHWGFASHVVVISQNHRMKEIIQTIKPNPQLREQIQIKAYSVECHTASACTHSTKWNLFLPKIISSTVKLAFCTIFLSVLLKEKILQNYQVYQMAKRNMLSSPCLQQMFEVITALKKRNLQLVLNLIATAAFSQSCDCDLGAWQPVHIYDNCNVSWSHDRHV